ncbi:MAG: hypothetical protein ACLFQU_11625 [Candidatus Kapaibacterium sp.]
MGSAFGWIVFIVLMIAIVGGMIYFYRYMKTKKGELVRRQNEYETKKGELEEDPLDPKKD